MFGTSKASKGTINHPVVVGGVLVNPGDWVLGDRDGVVIVPESEAESVLAAARTRREKEAEVIRRLKAGESLFDIYGYHRTFEGLGISEER